MQNAECRMSELRCNYIIKPIWCIVGADDLAARKFLLNFISGRCGVRVSGGHLCEAEAPTEPAGETHRPLQ